MWAVKDGARMVGLVASYVDGFICIGDMQICKEVMTALMKIFKMKLTWGAESQAKEEVKGVRVV